MVRMRLDFHIKAKNCLLYPSELLCVSRELKEDYSSKEGLLLKISVFLFMNGTYPFPLPPVADLFKNKLRRFNFSSKNFDKFKNHLLTQNF